MTREARDVTMAKRLADISISLIGLVVLSPLFLVTAVLIRIDSPGPVFFRQVRIGRDFRPFAIYKFRSMVVEAGERDFQLATQSDRRVTRFGRFLRRSKVDELPQLINVLKGEMSLVGPRPEAGRYVEMFRRDYEEILKVRPGMTDLASLKYRDEAELLGRSDDAEDEYVTRVLPDKIRMAKDYVARSSLRFDLLLIAKTALRVAGWNAVR